MSQLADKPDQLRVQCAASAGFVDWLAQAGGSVAVSTYQAGKVAMIGWDGRQVTLLMRQFDKPLGLAVEGPCMALATRHDVVLLANAPLLAPEYLEDQPGRYDALFLPRATYHTGDLHTHDIAFQGNDILLVNTRFSCLARLSRQYNFTPVWRPRFISDLVPEDRCHLNGVAMVDGRPKYVTALGLTDEPGGWRPNKASGGVVIDVETDQIVATGLSMPHSPRWYQGRLWVLNSGTGELWVLDPATGQRAVVCGLPGYLRGLCFVGPYGLIGLCKIREKHIFGGLPIQKRYDRLLCAVAVVDLRSGANVGMFEFTAGCEELYDVQFLPGVQRPMILNLDKPAVRQAVTNPDSSYWLRPSAEVPVEGAGNSGAGQHQPLPMSEGDRGLGFELSGTVVPGLKAPM
ncbi:MAG: TIGR03032 family protein [Thermoguttaceae bacterium]